jgi:hypothetical protein
MTMSRTLSKTFVEGLSKNHTFLIAPDTPAHTALVFFVITSTTLTQWFIAQYFLSEFFHWLRIEPTQD